MVDPTPIITEIVLSIAVEKTKKRAEKKIDEKKLKDSFQDFFKGQKEYHDICTLSEEFDFQSFVDYMNRNLFHYYMIEFSV